jgi:hypothetical protein
MTRTVVAALLLGIACAARAAYEGPIFDAHLHYNDDALPRYSVGAAFELFRKNGVKAILANSRPNDGTRLLYDAAQKSPSRGSRWCRSSACTATATTTARGSTTRTSTR